MSINVTFVNQKLDDEIHGYFDTKGQPHLVSAELVDYRDANVVVILQDSIPIWGYNLKAKNTDDAINEILHYLLSSYGVIRKNPELMDRIVDVGYDAFKEIK